MEIKKETVDGVCILIPSGRVDANTSGELDQAVTAALGEYKKTVLDMSGIDYVSSAGIRVIIQAHRTAGGEAFVLKNVSRNVFQLLAMTGFDKILNFE